MTLADLNSAPEEAVCEGLLACCGSKRWVQQVAGRRPFSSPEALYKESESIWWSLSASDWIQAFAMHPKIGERSSSKWSNEEQKLMADGQKGVAEAIRQMNVQYERKFGYIFILCATGKSAAEMCSLLQGRLGNEPAAELRLAAAEQAKIMRLRLGKLLAE